MPGYETIGQEELNNVQKIFTENNGVLYRYGFDGMRKHYFVKQFEEEFGSCFGTNALATSSGSSALKVALQALGVGPGDEVITQTHTFIATVEAICEVGATPVIANIDKTLNMCPESLNSLITNKTKCVIPVHMGGVACEMKKIMKICDSIDIKVLEDNAQAPGGTYRGQYLGTIGDMGIFSFDGGKMLTTGEGGMIVSHNKDLIQKARSYHDHGHADNPSLPRGEDDCIGIGFNHKMTELQGAIGLAQLAKINNTINKHQYNKTRILEVLDGRVSLRKRPNAIGDISDSISFFMKTPDDAAEFVKRWKEKGFGTKNLPDAINWHCAWKWNHIPFKSDNLDISQEIINRTISLPISIGMDVRKQQEALEELL